MRSEFPSAGGSLRLGLHAVASLHGGPVQCRLMVCYNKYLSSVNCPQFPVPHQSYERSAVADGEVSEYGGWTPAAVRAGLSAWGVVLPNDAECAEVAARLTLLVRLLSSLMVRLGTDPRTLLQDVPALQEFPRSHR